MPEGPEAHTIARELNIKLKDKYIISISVNERAKVFDLDKLVLPLKIIHVYAYGKRPIIELENKHLIATFLSMTGKWVFDKRKHTSLTLEYGDLTFKDKIGNKDHYHFDSSQYIYFDDIRTFGHIKYLYNQDLISSYFAKIGPDLISDPPTLEQYNLTIKNYNQNKEICQFLMDQSQFSGIGNYLKAEILYKSKIKPDKKLSNIGDEDVEILYNNTIDIINLSLEYGGLTISDYWTPDGSPGNYPRMVYGLSEDEYGNKIIKSKFKDNRTTHWVPDIQI